MYSPSAGGERGCDVSRDTIVAVLDPDWECEWEVVALIVLSANSSERFIRSRFRMLESASKLPCLSRDVSSS